MSSEKKKRKVREAYKVARGKGEGEREGGLKNNSECCRGVARSGKEREH